VARLRAVSHDDKLSLVEHLDELRSRIIVTLIVLGAGFALCFWQDDLLLSIANSALPEDQTPITLSPLEPFMTTVTVAGYGALVLALPVLFYQLYAFVIPAFSPAERKTVTPYVIAMPFLFVAGIAFAYFVVMPAAITFLLNFNSSEFNIEVRAKDYYSFFGLTLVSLGICFQMPIVLISLCRLGVTTPEQLAHSRRYAIFIISVVAAALPGGDPVSMILIMIPLVLLYEASVVLARRLGKPSFESEVGTTGEPATERSA
jgi:sec-independent protein translocase protein TatC